MIRFLIRNRTYARYWFGRWFSDLGDWVRNMTLIFLVMNLSHGSSRAIAVNMFCEFIPMFLAPVLGVFVDRWDRKRTFMWATTVRGVILVGIAWSLHYHSLYGIYFGALVGSIATVFTQTSESGLVMQMVPKDSLKTAASLKQLISSSMTLMGPPLGAGIFALIGGKGALIVAFLLFTLAAALIASLPLARFRREDVEENFASIISDLNLGWRYAKQHPLVPSILTVGFALGVSGGILNVLEVFIVTQFLGLHQTLLATMLAIQGLGMLLSVPIVNKWRIRMDFLLPVSVLIIGAGLGLMVSYPNFWVTVAGYLVFSFGNIAESTAMGTLLQTEVESEFQGRVISLLQTVSMGTMGLLMLITGWVHIYVSVQDLVLAAAAIALFSGAWVVLQRKGKSIKKIDSAEPSEVQ